LNCFHFYHLWFRPSGLWHESVSQLRFFQTNITEKLLSLPDTITSLGRDELLQLMDLVEFMSKYRNVIEWHSQLWFKVENVFRHNERNDNWLLAQSTWIFKTTFSYLVIHKRQSPVKIFVWSKAKNVGLECAYIGIFELLTFLFTFFFSWGF
jgi:hypothetical protein